MPTPPRAAAAASERLQSRRTRGAENARSPHPAAATTATTQRRLRSLPRQHHRYCSWQQQQQQKHLPKAPPAASCRGPARHPPRPSGTRRRRHGRWTVAAASVGRWRSYRPSWQDGLLPVRGGGGRVANRNDTGTNEGAGTNKKTKNWWCLVHERDIDDSPRQRGATKKSKQTRTASSTTRVPSYIRQ